MRNRIRELREERRLTQTELGRLLEADETAVSRWESGGRALTPRVIERLARIFKIDSWQLFFNRKALRRMVADTDVMPDSLNTTAEGSRER